MSFDIALLNWLAKLLDPSLSLASLAQGNTGKMMLATLLKKLTEAEYLLNAPESTQEQLKKLAQQLEQLEHSASLSHFYQVLRQYFESKPWIAITIPSSSNGDVDAILCDQGMAGFHVRTQANSKGLILQLDRIYQTEFSVLSIHPTLQSLLSQQLNWPGVLIMIPGGGAVFLPLQSKDDMEIDIEARLQWIFRQLFSDRNLNLRYLKSQYRKAFTEVFDCSQKTLHLLHLSDINIGSRHTAFRMHHLKNTIRMLIDELGEEHLIVPVITGNLLANPSENQLEETRQFWRFLETLGVEAPLFVFGQKDVRNDGNINESYRNAIGFQTAKVSWFEDEKLALVSLNSVVHGNLPEGYIGEEQIETIAYEISRKNNHEDFQYIFLIHHPPVRLPQQNIAQQTQNFYQTVFSIQTLAAKKSIQNTDVLMHFIDQYPVCAIVHGQSPQPRITTLDNNIPIIASGASNGVKSAYDERTYFNLNIVSINQHAGKKVIRSIAIAAETNEKHSFVRHEKLTMFSEQTG